VSAKFATSAVMAILGFALTTGAMVPANADPLPATPPCPTCQADPGGPPPGIPAMKCWPYGRVGAGNAVSGGGRPSYPPPCRATDPP
jgi:hypothetical protein